MKWQTKRTERRTKHIPPTRHQLRVQLALETSPRGHVVGAHPYRARVGTPPNGHVLGHLPSGHVLEPFPRGHVFMAHLRWACVRSSPSWARVRGAVPMGTYWDTS